MAHLRAKDFLNFVKTLDSFTAGQCQVVDYDSDDLSSLTIKITPTDGLYKGGKFLFKVGKERYCAFTNT